MGLTSLKANTKHVSDGKMDRYLSRWEGMEYFLYEYQFMH